MHTFVGDSFHTIAACLLINFYQKKEFFPMLLFQQSLGYCQVLVALENPQ
jgi:hypothetical protein